MPKTPQSTKIPEFILRLVFTREKTCSHLDLIRVPEPDRLVCQDCANLGDSWPNLRMCLICGYVGCCDTSKNKHMYKHVNGTGHPRVRSIDEGEGWIWCYLDEAFISANSRQLDETMVTS